MECSCTIDPDIGEEELRLTSTYITASQPTQCVECKRYIQPGELLLFESGVAASCDEKECGCDENDGCPVYTYTTCMDCKSIRDQFFHNFIYTMLIADLENFIDESLGSVHEDCIANLTPRAQELVCGYIEDIWQEIEENES